MKNKSFPKRFRYACSGVRVAWIGEKSFRTQIGLAVVTVGTLLFFRPAPVWWAIFTLTIAGVLSLELVNTALEHVVDRLHPDIHPLIRNAKDCAAGAVLIFSFAAVGIFIAFLLGR